MAQGGARARSGPPPDPSSLRNARSDASPWTHIPNVPSTDAPPPWPLNRRPTPNQLHHWKRLWRKPQAAMWRELGQEAAVAAHAAALGNSELFEGDKLYPILLRQEEQLGISIPGLLRNRWILDPVGVEVKGSKPDDSRRTSASRRFKTIEGGAAS